MKISVSSDTQIGIAAMLVDVLRDRGHDVTAHGALSQGDDTGWARAAANAAEDVAMGRADQAIVCCFTGTGATMAASGVEGIRAALSVDAFTASAARRWNDANVLGISLRLCSDVLLTEILDAWFDTTPDGSQDDQVALLKRVSR